MAASKKNQYDTSPGRRRKTSQQDDYKDRFMPERQTKKRKSLNSDISHSLGEHSYKQSKNASAAEHQSGVQEQE